MKIIIQDPRPGEEDSVVISVKHMSESVMRAIDILKSPEGLPVYTEDGATILALTEIFYCESVDLKTFIYADKIVYRSRRKLYELEEILDEADFLRISKQTILNVKKIKSVAPHDGGRFTAILLNGEKLIISRQYVPALKERFGL